MFFTIFFLKKSPYARNEKNSTFQYIAISVSFVYLIWGIYLLVLVISDLVFGNNFVIHKTLWQANFLCFFLFSINLNFNILSPMLSSFMSFSRLMVVIYPLNSKYKCKKFILKCCILMYVLTATLVTSYVIAFKHVYSSVPFRLCSPFIDPSHSNVMLRVTTCVVVCLQFIVYFTNIVFNNKIILILKSSTVKKYNLSSLFTQFSIATVSNTLCWIPSGIIFLFCMFTDEFSIVMVAWVVITMASVHSVTNSVLFIVTTARK